MNDQRYYVSSFGILNAFKRKIYSIKNIKAFLHLFENNRAHEMLGGCVGNYYWSGGPFRYVEINYFWMRLFLLYSETVFCFEKL